ncbi:hypothetical protein HK102_001705 [Quaeritorhiza haematococci]|nr:hypothetical protein HK102_001705 [Quaeritorhiza haematococci]
MNDHNVAAEESEENTPDFQKSFSYPPCLSDNVGAVDHELPYYNRLKAFQVPLGILDEPFMRPHVIRESHQCLLNSLNESHEAYITQLLDCSATSPSSPPPQSSSHHLFPRLSNNVFGKKRHRPEDSLQKMFVDSEYESHLVSFLRQSVAEASKTLDQDTRVLGSRLALVKDRIKDKIDMIRRWWKECTGVSEERRQIREQSRRNRSGSYYDHVECGEAKRRKLSRADEETRGESSQESATADGLDGEDGAYNDPDDDEDDVHEGDDDGLPEFEDVTEELIENEIFAVMSQCHRSAQLYSFHGAQLEEPKSYFYDQHDPQNGFADPAVFDHLERITQLARALAKSFYGSDTPNDEIISSSSAISASAQWSRKSSVSHLLPNGTMKGKGKDKKAGPLSSLSSNSTVKQFIWPRAGSSSSTLIAAAAARPLILSEDLPIGRSGGSAGLRGSGRASGSVKTRGSRKPRDRGGGAGAGTEPSGAGATAGGRRRSAATQPTEQVGDGVEAPVKPRGGQRGDRRKSEKEKPTAAGRRREATQAEGQTNGAPAAPSSSNQSHAGPSSQKRASISHVPVVGGGALYGVPAHVGMPPHIMTKGGPYQLQESIVNHQHHGGNMTVETHYAQFGIVGPPTTRAYMDGLGIAYPYGDSSSGMPGKQMDDENGNGGMLKSPVEEFRNLTRRNSLGRAIGGGNSDPAGAKSVSSSSSAGTGGGANVGNSGATAVASVARRRNSATKAQIESFAAHQSANAGSAMPYSRSVPPQPHQHIPMQWASMPSTTAIGGSYFDNGGQRHGGMPSTLISPTPPMYATVPVSLAMPVGGGGQQHQVRIPMTGPPTPTQMHLPPQLLHHPQQLPPFTTAVTTQGFHSVSLAPLRSPRDQFGMPLLPPVPSFLPSNSMHPPPLPPASQVGGGPANGGVSGPSMYTLMSPVFAGQGPGPGQGAGVPSYGYSGGPVGALPPPHQAHQHHQDPAGPSPRVGVSSPTKMMGGGIGN